MDYPSMFTKQKMMRTVLVSLIPVSLAAVFLFGWRPVLVGLFVTLAAVVGEYLVMRTIQKEKTKVSEAVFVSAVLFTLTLPPRTPIWVAVIGILFGIVFGKAAFGGFGRNIFNPALVGRCFIYIAFPPHMTMGWAQPYTSLPGGFAQWLPSRAADAVSGATPLIALENTGALTPLQDLLLGNIGGSLGETSAILLLLCGAFLLFKKVASWQIMTSTVGSGLLLSAILYYTGAAPVPPLFFILSGGFLFGAVFMATDPISAPKAKPVQWLYGVLIGLSTVIIRSYGLFAEGVMFAILIANALTPLMELKYRQYDQKRKQALKKEVVA